MLYALIGIFTGLAIGMMLPVSIPAAWSVYVAVSLFAMLSSVAGAIRANIKGEFSAWEFLSGLVLNVLLASGLAWMGDRLDIPGYMAAIVYFGFRIFTNINEMRKFLVKKVSINDNVT